MIFWYDGTGEVFYSRVHLTFPKGLFTKAGNFTFYTIPLFFIEKGISPYGPNSLVGINKFIS